MAFLFYNFLKTFPCKVNGRFPHAKSMAVKTGSMSKTACRRVKRSLFWAFWGISVYIQGIYAAKITFDLSRSRQGHVKVAHVKIDSISKTACRRSKRSLITVYWGISVYIQSIYTAKITFDLSRSRQGHVKVAHVNIGSISKTACRRAKRSLIWAPWGISVYIYSIYAAKITFDHSRSLQGHTFQNGRFL